VADQDQDRKKDPDIKIGGRDPAMYNAGFTERKGEWKSEGEQLICSKCRYVHKHNGNGAPDFCPKCDAEMRNGGQCLITIRAEA